MAGERLQTGKGQRFGPVIGKLGHIPAKTTGLSVTVK
jgi:hypothetical protein